MLWYDVMLECSGHKQSWGWSGVCVWADTHFSTWVAYLSFANWEQLNRTFVRGCTFQLHTSVPLHKGLSLNKRIELNCTLPQTTWPGCNTELENVSQMHSSHWMLPAHLLGEKINASDRFHKRIVLVKWTKRLVFDSCEMTLNGTDFALVHQLMKPTSSSVFRSIQCVHQLLAIWTVKPQQASKSPTRQRAHNNLSVKSWN